MLLSLVAYTARVTAALEDRQRELADQRTAARVGLEPQEWRALLAGNLDLALLRELHRMVCDGTTRVRHANRDGHWAVASARGGQLRSQPLSFRAAGHVEPAWDHGSLARRVNELIEATKAAGDHVAASAEFVWSLARAQPFNGRNESTALAFAARLLNDARLPVPNVEEFARDPGFTRAIAAPVTGPLVAYLTRAVWDAALGFAEWLSPEPLVHSTTPWTLADEHASCEASRARVRSVPDAELGAVVEAAAAAMPAALAARVTLLGPTRIVHSTHAERLRATVESGRRGRHVCLHRPIHELRWQVEAGGGLEAVLVAGTAGRGLVGSAALHISLALPDVPSGRAAPGLLLIPDENVAERAARLATWLPDAIEQVVRHSPLRI